MEKAPLVSRRPGHGSRAPDGPAASVIVLSCKVALRSECMQSLIQISQANRISEDAVPAWVLCVLKYRYRSRERASCLAVSPSTSTSRPVSGDGVPRLTARVSQNPSRRVLARLCPPTPSHSQPSRKGKPRRRPRIQAWNAVCPSKERRCLVPFRGGATLLRTLSTPPSAKVSDGRPAWRDTRRRNPRQTLLGVFSPTPQTQTKDDRP